MRTRIFRLLVCLVLICALLVQVSPIRAEAVSTGVAVSAGIVASAIIYGLGVAVGDYPDEFNSLVADSITAMQTAGVVITNGLMDVMSLGSGLFGVKSDTVQSLFDWFYDSNVLSYGPILGTSATYIGNTYYADRDVIPYAYRYQTSSSIRYYVGLCSREPFKWKTTGGWSDAYSTMLSATSETVYYTGHNGILYEDNPYYTEITNYPMLRYNNSSSAHDLKYNLQYFLDNCSVSTSNDLTLNFVANPGVSLATGYPAWHANSVTIPNAETDEDEIYYPLALGNSMEETQSFTQEQVWAGEGTYVDTETGTGSGSITVPDTVTLKDILAGVLSVPQSIAQAVTGLFSNVVAAVQAVPAAIIDFFTITSADLVFPVSLMDFFPFCIPGDIYELVTVFDAEPEAPHFVYDVDFPYMDEPWHIDVDLDPWDPVAQVLRRLELLLFIVGLAMATRNYYIRG